MNKDERCDWAKNNEAIERAVNPGAFPPVERTAQACEPVKVPVGQPLEMEASHDGNNRFKVGTVRQVDDFQFVPAGGLDPAPLPVKIQQAHLAARAQNDMTVACAIASELGRESRDKDDPESLAALMLHVGTQSGATLELLKIVQRIGLRQWFEGDYVVLSMRDACEIVNSNREGGAGIAALDCAIQKAAQ